MKNRKLISSGLILFILILSLSSFINVGYAQAPNVELISEAGITTRWDFVNETAGYNTTYFEPFDNASSYWELFGVSENYFGAYMNESYLFDNSTYISCDYTATHFDTNSEETDPQDITYDGTYLWVVGHNTDEVYRYTTAGVYTGVHFDVGTEDGLPLGITWDGTHFWVVGKTNLEVYQYTSAGVYTTVHFDIGGETGDPQGITWNGTHFLVVDPWTDEVYEYNAGGVYTGVHFDTSVEDDKASGIIWDGAYFWITAYDNNEVYQYNITGDYTGIHFDVGTEDGNMFGITWDETYFWTVGSGTDEVYQYTQYLNVSKKYQGNGYLYMQTNTSETLTLRSLNNLSLTLQEGDKIEIGFNTSSANRIDFNLRNNSIQQVSYMLSIQGNGDFSDRVKTFTVSSNISVDQIEFTGSFVDTKNLIVDYVKVFRSFSDVISYYVEPYGRRELDLGHPHNYTVEIYEHDDLKETKHITTLAILQTLIYERIDGIIVYINYFNANNEYLDFNNYVTYVNYTLDNSTYTNKRLSSNILYADENTQIYFKIYDSFNALIKTMNQYEETFIDITLDVYSLKIKNEYQEPVFYELKNNDTEIIKLGNIFSQEIIEYSLASGNYIFNYTKDGDESSVNIDFLGHQILVINSSKMCFLTYVNQKGEYLFFNNYKTYIDTFLIYYNVFYRDVGDNVSVEIKDLYDISVKNHSFIVQTEDNYVPIILTQYSLKVMNQQEQFNHINITRDPNYYVSSYYWSEWVAPNEIVKFRLFPGYYKINLTDNEGGSYSFYEYTLSGDDILLISSDNVLSQVIYNIANINTTIGNLITNVEINITNQNSQINNSIINIDIDLGNINSTLGTMLVNLDVDITNIANNISTFYAFTNTSFINLNTAMNNSFIYMENNIIAVNQTISNLVIGVSNDIYLINGTISTMITQLETNLLLMNVSIDTALFSLNTTLNLIGSNITSNYILLNNTLNLMDININDSRIAIINNLLLVNNTISTLIADVYSAVYLINNSIYTAVVDLGTYLSLVNNTINGNLSIVLQMNEFLTELYQMTMFSDLLNWTDIGLNISLLTSQIDAWTFVNNYINQSIEVHLKYQDIIEKLVISADDSIEQYLPKEDVEYRLWSVDDEKYIDEWEELDPKNKTVNFGFFEMDVPEIPEPLETDNTTIISTIMIFSVIGAIIVISWQVRKGANMAIEASTDGKYTAYRPLDKRKIGLIVVFIILISVITLIFVQILIR